MSAGIRVNMAAIAARLAADDQEYLGDEEPFSGDAGEIHAGDFGGGGIGVSMLTTVSIHDSPFHSPQSGRTGNHPTALSALSRSPTVAHQYSQLFGRGGNSDVGVTVSAPPVPHPRSSVAAGAKYTRSQSGVSVHSSSRAGRGSSVGTTAGGSTSAAKASLMKREMAQLRADITNALDALTSQREDITNYVDNSSSRYASNSNEAMAALSVFDTRFIHMEKVGHDIPRLMKESNLQLKVPFFLNAFGDISDFGGGTRPSSRSRGSSAGGGPPGAFHLANIKVPSAETISTVLAPVLTTDMSPPPPSAAAATTRPTSSIINTSADPGIRFLSTIRKEVTSKLFPLDDHQIPEMLLAINSLMKTDIVIKAQQRLNQTDDLFKELTEKIKAQEVLFDQHKSIEDYAAAEVALQELLSLSAQRTDLGADRVGLLIGNEAGGGSLDSLDRILYNRSIATLKKEKEKYIAQAKKDLESMETDHHSKHTVKNNDEKRKYEDATARSHLEIAALVNEQKNIFDEISAKLMQLDAIGHNIESKVGEHTHVTDVEQKRRQEYREYTDSYARHRTNLNSLIDNSRAALSFLESVRSLAQQGKAQIEKSDVRAALRALTVEERRRYLMAYKHYGDSSHTNMARLDKKLANASHIQEDMRSFIAASTEQDSDSAPGSRPGTTSTDSRNLGAALSTPTSANAISGPALYSQRIVELEAAKDVATSNLGASCESYAQREDRFIDLMAAINQSLGGAAVGGVTAGGDTHEDSFRGANMTEEEEAARLVEQQARLLDNTDEGDLLVALRRRRVDIFQDHLFLLEGVAKGTKTSQEEVRRKHEDISEQSARLLEVVNARKARKSKYM